MASEITNNLSSTNINGILNALLSVSENEVFVQAMKGVNIKNLTDRVNLYNETVNSLTTISNIVLDPDKLKNVLSSTQKTLDVFKGFNILTDDKNTPEVKELESLFDKTQSILNIIVEKTKEVEIQDDNSFIDTNERVVGIINSIVSVSDSVKSFVENFEIPDENTIIGNIDSLRILVEYIKEGGKEIHVAEQTITNFAVTAEGVDKIISSMSSIGSSVEKLLEEKLPDAKKVKIACNGLLNIVYKIIDKVQNSDITQEAITQTSEKIKPIQEVIENFSKILGVLGSFNVLNIVGIMIYQKALDPSFEVINGILTKVNEMKVTEEMAEKLTPLKNIVDSISSIVTELVKTAMLSMVLVVMQIPLKLAIGVIADINTLITEKFAEAKDLENAAKNLGVIGNALAELAKGLLLFVTLTMFGVVPLFAIVSLLAVKLFLNVFFRLFDKDSFKQIDMSNEAIKQVTITLFMLSGLVLMWALTGILILEAWPQILTTVLFVVVAIGVFILLGHLSKYIEEGNKSLYSIAATLIILSLTVLLWALTGELILERWDSILVTVGFVLLAIGTFILLGWLSKFIKKGSESLLITALVLVILSLTVLLWAETGQTIMDSWVQILVVTSFVLLAIGVMWILGKSVSTTMKGAITILLLSAALIVLGLTVLLYTYVGDLLLKNMLEVLMVTVFIGIMIGLCYLLSMAAGVIIAGVGVLALLGVALLLFSVSLVVFVVGLKLLDWDDIAKAGVILVAIGLAMAAIGIVAPLVILGAAAMLVFSAAILVFSIGLITFAIALKLLDEGDIELAGGIIWSLGKAVMKIGAVFPLIILGSAALTILSAGLLLFTVPLLTFISALAQIRKINVTVKDIATPINLMRGFAKTINKTFRGRDMLTIGLATVKIRSLLPISTAISRIALTMQQIASLSIPSEFDSEGKPKAFVKMETKDFVNAATNASVIVRILANTFGDKDLVVDIMGQKVKLSPVSQKALDGITWRTKRKMQQLETIVRAIGGMATTLSNVASLIIPDETAGFDKDGKPKGWKTMKKEDFITASENVAAIAITLVGALTEYRSPSLGNRTVAEAVEDMSRRAIKKIGMVLSSFGNIKGIVDAVQQMAQMSVPIRWDENGQPTAYKILTEAERQQAIDNTIDLMTQLLKAIGSDEVSDALNKLGPRARRNIDTVMKSCGGISSLVDAVKKSAEFDESTIATGITNVKECILRYVGVLNDLFVDKWGWARKKVKIFKWTISIPYPTIVDKAEVDMGKLKGALAKMEELSKTIAPMKNLSQSIQEFGKMDFKDISPILQKIKNCVKEYVEIIGSLTLDTNFLRTKAEEINLLITTVDPLKAFIKKVAEIKLDNKEADRIITTLINTRIIVYLYVSTLLSVIIDQETILDKIISIDWLTYSVDYVERYINRMKDLVYADEEYVITRTAILNTWRINCLYIDFLFSFWFKQRALERQLRYIDYLTYSIDYYIKPYINKVKELDFSDSERERVNTSILNTGRIIDSYNYLISEKINNISNVRRGKFGILSSIIDEQQRFANINTEHIQQNTDNFVRFIDKANSIDVEKIRTVRDLFAEMTEFSRSVKGNFEKLADVLSEKLVKVLEKLSDTMQGINEESSSSEFDEVIVTNPFKQKSLFNKNVQQPTENQKPRVVPQKDYARKLNEIEGDLDDMIALLRQIKENTER
jgi:hypothetical protein